MDFNEVKFYTKELRVLYVEDNENLLKETKELLDNFFKTIVTATNGEIGLELYKNGDFDLVITDIKMPKMDGIELSKNIIQINPNQHIIITSAYNDSDKLLSLIQIGISDFLLKPMNLPQLLKVLYKVSKSIYNHKKEKEYLISQSRLAIMGEMVDMIAHQWLQYINVLSLKIELLSFENRDTLTEEKIDDYIKGLKKEIDNLVVVLNEFRGFFREKDVQLFSIREIVDSVLILMKDYLIKNVVDVEVFGDYKVWIYPNEFKQVILNIITNMVDNFNEKEIEDRKIVFDIKDNTLTIKDNGGGVDDEVIDTIFEAKVTTKKYGTGMGLYLSRLIIEKIDGKIGVTNIDNGAEFKILFKN
jgi:YesN/AraC family two-component response regulator